MDGLVEGSGLLVTLNAKLMDDSYEKKYDLKKQQSFSLVPLHTHRTTSILFGAHPTKFAHIIFEVYSL